ncbi:MAG TPA: hypothetical protein VGM37_19040 [Armatimonadota bacterium]|jgi:N-acetylmuramic acid 6-phosphate etherase
MSSTSRERAEAFLKIAPQFQLGSLTTEKSHPATAQLSQTADRDVPAALRLLFDADADVLATYRAFAESGRAPGIAQSVVDAVKAGGRVFFTGCGSTGRLSIQLDSIWRTFWRRQAERGFAGAEDFENRTFSVMAGGDYALIKSVEGFEDFTQFGRKQIGDLGVGPRDVAFAITEGGETSFVIGTAWQALDNGAKVYFVYNNPDDALVATVQRSREVIQEPRITKINLTTGPMGITGSTRMQATTIQLAVMTTILEMAIRTLMGELEPNGPCALDPAGVPAQFLAKLEETLATLRSDAVCQGGASIVGMEEAVYRAGHKNNYFANAMGIDMFTDTTERSPTFCTPPFRKIDDDSAAESWAFVYLPFAKSEDAWRHIFKRAPRCVDWSDDDVRALVDDDQAERSIEIAHIITEKELMRFKVGLDGLSARPLGPGDSAVALLAPDDAPRPDGFPWNQIQAAKAAGAKVGAIIARKPSTPAADAPVELDAQVTLTLPETDLLLDGLTRCGTKMLLNALSTCTMVRLGRVMGNTMIYVVPSNLKLIDRSTRYVQTLAGLGYEEACYLVHEVMEYVQPRMLADQVYPPVVGVCTLRALHHLTNEEAEERLSEEAK